jgi:hypothetical protein
VTPPGVSVETLEGRKLRRGSAVCAYRGQTRAAARIHCWSKALEARPEISTRNPFRTACRSLAAVVHSCVAAATEKRQEGSSVMMNRGELAVRENPWRAAGTPWALPA